MDELSGRAMLALAGQTTSALFRELADVQVVFGVELGLGGGLVAAFVGIGFWGLHLALTQGLLAKLVADTAPSDRSGSAFGIFNVVTGLTLLLASVLAGIIWDRLGPLATFVVGGSFATAAAVLLVTGQVSGLMGPDR